MKQGNVRYKPGEYGGDEYYPDVWRAMIPDDVQIGDLLADPRGMDPGAEIRVTPRPHTIEWTDYSAAGGLRHLVWPADRRPT